MKRLPTAVAALVFGCLLCLAAIASLIVLTLSASILAVLAAEPSQEAAPPAPALETLAARALSGTIELAESEVNGLLDASLRSAAVPASIRLRFLDGAVEVEFGGRLDLVIPSAATMLPPRLRGAVIGLPVRLRVLTVLAHGRDVLRVRLCSVRLGVLPLPLRAVEAWMAAYIERNDVAGLVWSAAEREFHLSLRTIGRGLGSVFSIRSVWVGQGSARLETVVNDSFLAANAGIIRDHFSARAPALRAAVRRSLRGASPGPAGRFVNAADAVIHGLSRLGTPGRLGGFAVIAHFERDVEIVREEGSSDRLPPVPGLSVPERAVIRTGRGSSVELLLADESVIRLGEQSILRLENLHGGAGGSLTVLGLMEGRLRAVVPVVPGRRGFTIRTGSSLFRVIGTDFGVEYLPAEQRLSAYVLRGRLAADSVRTVMVNAGQEGFFERADAKALLRPLSPERRGQHLRSMEIATSASAAFELLIQAEAQVLLGVLRELYEAFMSLDEPSRAELNRLVEPAFDAPDLIARLDMKTRMQ